MFHCDLSTQSLLHTAAKAREQGILNIAFLRIDYFQPPFRRSLDRLICLDTLIRAPFHELTLLRGIAASLAPRGRAVIDSHNYWHNPLRRMGWLPENFIENRG